MYNTNVFEKPKVFIMYVSDGYMITDSDGIEWDFNDGSKTKGYKNKFDAMKTCEEHDYDFEII